MAKKNKKLRHPWLDANDPANTERGHEEPGYWVPTPGEIEYGCEQAREWFIKTKVNSIGGIDEQRFIRLPKEVASSDQRRAIVEDSQLCDCPYWGTEFATGETDE